MASVRRSTTEIGTAFEKHSQRYLNHHLHMSLRRVGGAGDGGVDLRGSWYVPPDTLGAGPSRRRASSTSLDSPVGGGEASGREAWRRLRVVAQCKAEKKGLGPRAVRELEGVVAHLEGLRRKGKERSETIDGSLEHDCSNIEELSETIAILLSQSPFSKNAMLHALKSHTPLMLVHLRGGQAGLPPLADGQGGNESDAEVGGVWWNAAASGPTGVLSGKMELRREILSGSNVDSVTGDVMVKARYGLYHRGRRFSRLGPPLDEAEDIA